MLKKSVSPGDLRWNKELGRLEVAIEKTIGSKSTDDTEWLELADEIAKLDVDTSLKVDAGSTIKTSMFGRGVTATGEPIDAVRVTDGREIETIWIDEVADIADDMMFKAMKESEQHQEENSLVKINSLISTEIFSEFFIYNQPGSVTVKSEDGSFSKKRVIGGERFLIKRAYKGKKSTIFVFDVEGSSWKGKQAELSKADASRFLTGFDDWYEKLMGAHDSKVLSDAKKPAEVIEKEASERYEAQGDTSFGSW